MVIMWEPVGGLDDDGKPYEPVPLSRKLIGIPLVLVLLVILWPVTLWAEMKEDPWLVKIMKFPVRCVVLVATLPLLPWRVWREFRASRRRGAS
jgi:hypothetical protein